MASDKRGTCPTCGEAGPMQIVEAPIWTAGPMVYCGNPWHLKHGPDPREVTNA